MELRQLRCFVVVAEELHFARAAQRLYVSAPALSQTVRSLERELGTALFARSPVVALTPAGALLLEHARAVLARADAALAALKEQADGSRAALAVGTAGLGAAEAAAPLLSAFRVQHPDVALRVRELDFACQVTQLLGGRVDVAFVRLPLLDARVEVVALLAEPRVAVLPARHPLADAEALPVAALLDERFVGLDPGVPPSWAGFWRLDEHRSGVAPRIGDQGARTTLEVLAGVALDGDVFTAAASLARSAAFDGVAFAPLPDVAPSELGIACRADDERRHVAAFVRGVAKLARGGWAAAPVLAGRA